MRPPPRSRAQRKADALALLRTEVDCWMARSADEMGNAHLVPLRPVNLAAPTVRQGPALAGPVSGIFRAWREPERQAHEELLGLTGQRRDGVPRLVRAPQQLRKLSEPAPAAELGIFGIGERREGSPDVGLVNGELDVEDHLVKSRARQKEVAACGAFAAARVHRGRGGVGSTRDARRVALVVEAVRPIGGA